MSPAHNKTQWIDMTQGSQIHMMRPDANSPDTSNCVLRLANGEIVSYNSFVYTEVMTNTNFSRKDLKMCLDAFHRDISLFVLNKPDSMKVIAHFQTMRATRTIDYTVIKNAENFAKWLPGELKVYLATIEKDGKRQVNTGDALLAVVNLLKRQGSQEHVQSQEFRVDMLQYVVGWRDQPLISLDELKSVLENFDVDKTKITLIPYYCQQYRIRR
ncbi:unnamed protein product [Caenorhabditis sp. 36 PRJEB53466]|nr:unnamed protein product [Caenorhabditis sp. 36 PRJEB53466]